MNSTKDRYKHAEAFCLMKYTCEACGYTEILWNSRDGVTPFIIQCRNCGKPEAVHKNWMSDRCAPDYELQPGQRYFRDATEEEIRENNRKTVYRARGKDKGEEIEKLIDRMTREDMQHPYPVVRVYRPEEKREESKDRFFKIVLGQRIVGVLASNSERGTEEIRKDYEGQGARLEEVCAAEFGAIVKAAAGTQRRE